VGSRCRIIEYDPCLSSQLISFDANTVANATELAKHEIQSFLQLRLGNTVVQIIQIQLQKQESGGNDDL
jgi:hypothetical protein